MTLLWIWAFVQMIAGVSGCVFFLAGISVVLEDGYDWIIWVFLGVALFLAGWTFNGVQLANALSEREQLQQTQQVERAESTNEASL